MGYGERLKLKKEDNIGIVTLCNPQGLNMVDEKFLDELTELQEIIDHDKSLRVLVINAEGDHFSAGADLNFLISVDSQFIMDNLVWLQRLHGRWQDLPIPVIVAVQGLCYGGGMELILGCDIRIAAENARFAIPEVRFGLAPDMGGTTRLTKLVGVGQAKRMIIGCEEIDAEEALRIGLIEIMVKNDKLNERALKLAKRITNLPPAAVRFAKMGINVAHESSTAASLLFEQAQSTFCCGTEDQNEGIHAFFEKRKPVFKGK